MKIFNKNILSAALLVLLVACSAQSAHADTFTFVGSYHVGDGPAWYVGTPAALSARQAAALLFGGVYSDYAISTNSNTVDPNTITFTGLYDGFGVHPYGGTQFGQDFVQTCGGGIYANNGGYCGQTYSAYINDAYGPGNRQYYGDPINYVWKDNPGNPVPEPGSLVLLGSGLIGLGGTLRKRFLN